MIDVGIANALGLRPDEIRHPVVLTGHGRANLGVADIQRRPGPGFAQQFFIEFRAAGPAPGQIFQAEAEPELLANCTRSFSPARVRSQQRSTVESPTQTDMNSDVLAPQLGHQAADSLEDPQGRLGLLRVFVPQICLGKGTVKTHFQGMQTLDSPNEVGFSA